MIDSRSNEPSGYDTGSGIASGIESGAETIREKASEMKESAKERLHQLKDAATEKLEQGWDTVKSWESGMENQIARHPIGSILIAVGAGLLVGLLIRRK